MKRLKHNQQTEENWDKMRSGVEKCADVSRALAEKFGAVYVPLQRKLDELCEKSSDEYWTIDGVHPSAAGHMVIAEAWIKAFEEI